MRPAKEVVTVILAESALELVPREIAWHPSVRRWAQRRGKSPAETLLDVSFHYSAMKGLRDREKRGRPDIVHFSLLEALSSPLNLEGRLRFVVHTINDYAIFVDPSTRVPRNYLRFVGLMEQVLKYGRAPVGSPSPLIQAVAMDYPNLLRELAAGETVLLDEGGVRERPREICRVALERGVPITIGGFPRGSFSPAVRSFAKYVFSIYPRPLDTWVVVSRVISGCEELLQVL